MPSMLGILQIVRRRRRFHPPIANRQMPPQLHHLNFKIEHNTASDPSQLLISTIYPARLGLVREGSRFLLMI